MNRIKAFYGKHKKWILIIAALFAAFLIYERWRIKDYQTRMENYFRTNAQQKSFIEGKATAAGITFDEQIKKELAWYSRNGKEKTVFTFLI